MGSFIFRAAIHGRQKSHHFRVWYRDELSQLVKEVLQDPRAITKPYLNGRHVEEIVMAHLKGWGNYTLEIHKVLTSELIQQQLVATELTGRV